MCGRSVRWGARLRRRRWVPSSRPLPSACRTLGTGFSSVQVYHFRAVRGRFPRFPPPRPLRPRPAARCAPRRGRSILVPPSRAILVAPPGAILGVVRRPRGHTGGGLRIPTRRGEDFRRRCETEATLTPARTVRPSPARAAPSRGPVVLLSGGGPVFLLCGGGPLLFWGGGLLSPHRGCHSPTRRLPWA